jgi:hypothetical protein
MNLCDILKEDVIVSLKTPKSSEKERSLGQFGGVRDRNRFGGSGFKRIRRNVLERFF